MSRRTSPPFRADHVGSLLRPPRLHQAREDFAAGRIEAAGLRAVEDEEITRAVRMQEEVGLQSATDGEFRRATWHMDFINQIGGIGQAAGHIKVRFRNALTLEWSSGRVEGLNTRTKLLKRQMYGRASFPLLRKRILLTS